MLIFPPKPPPRVDRVGLERRLGAAITGDDFYARLWAVGNEYGPAFRLVEWVKAAKGELLAKVRASDADSEGYRFPPTIFDAALQPIIGLAEEQKAFMPIGIGRVTVFGRPGGALYSHARSSGATADLDVFDDQGSCLVAFERVKLHFLERDSDGPSVAWASPLPDRLLYYAKWAPAAQ